MRNQLANLVSLLKGRIKINTKLKRIRVKRTDNSVVALFIDN